MSMRRFSACWLIRLLGICFIDSWILAFSDVLAPCWLDYLRPWSMILWLLCSLNPSFLDSLIACFSGSVVRWLLGSWIFQFLGLVESLAPWFFCSLIPWLRGSLIPWFLGSLIPLFLGSLFPLLFDSLILWFHGSALLCSLVPWFLGSLIPSFLGYLILYFLGSCTP